MRDWTQLAERIDELRLTPFQRKVAERLIGGHSTHDIALATGAPENRIKLCAAYLLFLLRRRPPGSLAPIIVKVPPRKPWKAGAALKLPIDPELPNEPRNVRSRT